MVFDFAIHHRLAMGVIGCVHSGVQTGRSVRPLFLCNRRLAVKMDFNISLMPMQISTPFICSPELGVGGCAIPVMRHHAW